MTEAVIVALITAAASVLCQAAISRRASSLMAYRIGELEKKVMRHNNLVERMAVAERDLKTAFRLIDGLREEQGHGH